MMPRFCQMPCESGRGLWIPPLLSCPEVDLEVIEEYLQEHSQDVQPYPTPGSPSAYVGQHVHVVSHQNTRIIEYSKNSWSGQHAYEWHNAPQTPSEDYQEQTQPPALHSPHDNQWVGSSN